MTALFVSHASADAVVTGRWVTLLEAAGFGALFVDVDPEQGIAAGQPWERELYAQLRRADAVLFLASPAAVESQWCAIEIGVARALGRDVFPVQVVESQRHPLLTDVQWVDATAGEEQAFTRLLIGLKRAGLGPEESLWWDPSRSPYPGLVPFEPADAAVFFGREPEIGRLVELVTPTVQRGQGGFVTVVGPSGSGKSSLVRAGLLPRLALQSGRWVLVPPLVPGDAPTAALARSLTAALASQDRNEPGLQAQRVAVDQAVENGSADLIHILRELCPAGSERSRVLVVVDQAEELLTRCGAEERGRFLHLLRGALSPDSPLSVVATLRAEFLSRFVAEEGLAGLLDEPMVIGPLPRSRLPQVIARPAQRAGLDFQAGLVERMVDDTVGGDALPLLAYTLREMAERAEPGRPITDEDYTAVGGVVGALRRQADRISDELTRDGRGLAVLPTLLRLTSVQSGEEPTRRRVPRRNFTAEQQVVVQAFVEARLLTSNGQDESTATVEVAHEALLRQWPPLRQAIDAARRQLELLSELEHLTRAWHEAGRDDSYLLRGVRLAQAQELGEGKLRELDPTEQDYVTSSQTRAAAEVDRTRRMNRQLRRLVGGLAVLALAAVAGLGFGLRSAADARNEATIARSGALAANAKSLLPDRLRLSTLLALESARAAPTPEALGAVAAALSEPAPAVTSLHHLRHGGPVATVAFSPDWQSLATAGEDGVVRLWDPWASPPSAEPLVGHAGAVTSLVFGPDAVLASAGVDGTVRLWDVASRQSIGKPLTGHTGTVTALAFGPDGVLASAGVDGTVRFWDLASRRLIGKPLTGHKDSVTGLAFNSFGELASASIDGTVRYWRVDLQSQLKTPLTARAGAVTAVAFSPNGQAFATAHADRTVRLWPMNSAQPLAEPMTGHAAPVEALAFSPDGRVLASAGGDSTVRLWDVKFGWPLGEPLTGHEESVKGVAFAGNGIGLASAGDDGTVRLWAVDSRRPIGEPLTGRSERLEGVTISPDGTTVATAADDGEVQLWDVKSEWPLGEPLTHNGRILSVAYDPKGRVLAAAGDEDGLVQLWDVRSLRPMGEPLTHTGGVLAVAFSPDGRVLASAGVNGRLQLWDVESRQQLGEPLTGHTGGAVTGVAFSPDGQVLASSGLDGTVRLWDPATASQTALLTGPGHTAQVNAVAISPDGQVLASAGADGTVRLWDVSSQRASGRPMPGHTGAVRSLAFVSNEVLSSAGDDGTVRLWDVPARRALGEPLTGHDGQVTGVAFSPLRKALASAGGDGTLRLWLTPPHWIQAACKLVGSNLTRIEWDTWIGADRSYVRTCPDLPPGRDALRDAPAGRYASPLAASRD